jgi:iron(III) transport system substrate-binding protein
VALANTYYYVRLASSQKPEDIKLMESVALVFPNQKSFGTHLNVSGAGVLKNAPHRDAAIRYLEYLASDAAQSYFASGNNEWPAVAGAPLNNRNLEALGKFKSDALNVSALGKNQPTAQKIFDRAGFR